MEISQNFVAFSQYMNFTSESFFTTLFFLLLYFFLPLSSGNNAWMMIKRIFLLYLCPKPEVETLAVKTKNKIYIIFLGSSDLHMYSVSHNFIPPSFLQEIKVIIKISSHPWYPINCYKFEKGCCKKNFFLLHPYSNMDLWITLISSKKLGG